MFQRPNMNRKYSKLMSGTDVMNQRESYYIMEARSVRFYKKVGLHFIQMLEQNALCWPSKMETRRPDYSFEPNSSTA